MKNWKRIAALAMSAVMVGGMLTGCGGGGGSTEAAKDNAPKAEAGAEAGKDEGGASADSGEKKQVYVSSATGATCLTGTAWRPAATVQ